MRTIKYQLNILCSFISQYEEMKDHHYPEEVVFKTLNLNNSVQNFKKSF